MKSKNNAGDKLNKQMAVLQALGIIFVILGHIKNDKYTPGTMSNWFPFYSFHMPLFIFISGYFYKEDYEESSFLKFLIKKIKTLIIPYYIFNMVAYILQEILYCAGYSIGNRWSLFNWIVLPWISTQQATFAIPTWFLIALFLAECEYVLFRKLFRKITKCHYENILICLFFFIGIAAAYIANHVTKSDCVIAYLRTFCMLFFLQLGRIYKKYEYMIKNVPDRLYYASVFACQFILIVLSKNSFLSPGLYALVDFEKSGIMFYATGITGIAFWLRVSSSISKSVSDDSIILKIGKCTKWIMAFHLIGFFTLNSIISVASSYTNFFSTFDGNLYKAQIYYSCVNEPRLFIVYLAFGLCIPLLINAGYEVAKGLFVNKIIKTVHL